jgi:hypothetical protein
LLSAPLRATRKQTQMGNRRDNHNQEHGKYHTSASYRPGTSQTQTSDPHASTSHATLSKALKCSTLQEQLAPKVR